MGVENVHAVMAIDPGGTTGVAACHVELQRTLKATLIDGMIMRHAVEVKGEWLAQGAELADMITKFMYVAQCEKSIPASNCHIVFENYVLRMPATSTNLAPVWVGAATVANITRENGWVVEWQMPSTAKAKAPNKRLKLWGLWEVGSEHKRDAWRHAATKIDGLIR